MKKFIKYFIYTLPLIEIALFIIVGKYIGVLLTLLLIVLSTIAGLILLRRQNFIMLKRMQESIMTKQPPAFDIIENSFKMIAGILLIIPGFLTDLIGLLFLVPKLRAKLFKLLIKIKAVKKQPEVKKETKNVIIDGECWHEDEKDNP